MGHSNARGIDELPARIADKISPVPYAGCWLWTGYIMPNGYGKFRWQGRNKYAHRATYELLVGPIPVGLELDHLCRVRCCCNPEHLEPVTRRENILRGIGPSVTRERLAGKTWTHCKHGHPLSGENLYVWPRGGKRICRACAQLRKITYRTRKVAS